ncbi:hypothetical protein PSTG_06314 [Puccinia striiformis f. sp. tritici PST-78]|uniref:UPF3 domain-containing protein n=1 Tax=Puccinia striiformis f. sp. tritici PST-78 TaxID=1165861 RepID=A0A0L0VM80_9BASI|nr:hypothetical protein PSTG_06314 [Puccinia striiformis f. sp. tritici PST-78]
MSERNKLVVRHLPANLPEHIFWKSVAPWLEPCEEGQEARCTATFKSFIPGKTRLNKTKVEIPSRAYIQFATSDQVVEFHQGYASQAFRDSHGNLTYPKVEFAPYQKVAGPLKKIDNRIGTIDSDNDYLAFLEGLKPAVAELNTDAPNKPDPLSENVDRPEITPLIEHLRGVRKAAQEAAMTAKQQRQQANSTKSTTLRPTQIMKRGVINNSTGGSSSSPTVSGFPSRKTTDSVPHDPPPHMLNPVPSSDSKGGNQQTGKSASNPPPKSSTSRTNKPAKSKRSGRGTDDKASTAINHQPKTILQAPKTNDSNPAEKASINPNQSSSTKKENTSSLKKQSPTLEQQPTQHQQNGPTNPSTNSPREGPKKSSRGGGGSGGSGRGGKAGKSKPGPAPSTSQHQIDPSATTTPSKNHELPLSKNIEHQPDLASETAAARRRLGNALAGISSKNEHPTPTPSSSRKKHSSPKKSTPASDH